MCCRAGCAGYAGWPNWPTWQVWVVLSNSPELLAAAEEAAAEGAEALRELVRDLADAENNALAAALVDFALDAVSWEAIRRALFEENRS